jgi:hypothetical protein
LNNTIKDYGLFLLDELLCENGSSLQHFESMPCPECNWRTLTKNPFITEQLNYNLTSELAHAVEHQQLLNTDQQSAYDQVTRAALHDKNCMFFLNRPGGTGKTWQGHVKVQPSRGRSEKYRGTWDNQRCLEPGLELRRMKGTKHKAWTEVRRPATLAEGMGQRGVASSKSNVIGSQKGSGIAFSGTTECKSGGDSKGLSNKQGLASADGLCHWFSQVPETRSSCKGPNLVINKLESHKGISAV